MTATAPARTPAAAAPVRRGRAAAAAVVCLGLFMLGLDLTVLNVAVPDLQGGLNTSTAQVQWIVDGYALVLGGTVLAVGAFTDAWGRRRSFVCGVAVCAGASLGGAMAAEPWQVIAARCTMGAGAALLMPATLAVIHQLFPEARLRSRAIAAWAAVGGMGGLCGPVIGGWLVEHFSWRAAFWINLPLAAVIIVLALLLVPESYARRRAGFDVAGAALSAAGLLVLVWSITESPHRGWTSPAALTGFAAAALLLAAFVHRQLRAPAPMLPLSLLRVPAIGVAAAALALMSFAMFGALFVLTLYLQGVLGFSPWQAGVRTLPLPAGLALGAVCAVPVRARMGGRVPVVGGLALVTAGFAILATTTPDSDYPHCAAFQLVAGVGAGLVAAAATESVMGSVATERAGLGSAINDATRQVGSALGVAVQGSLLAAVFTSRLTASLTDLHAPAPVAAAARHSILSVPAQAMRLHGPLRGSVLAAARRAFTDAMTLTAVVAGAVTLLTAAAAARWLGRPDRAHDAPRAGRTPLRGPQPPVREEERPAL
ncbi:MFS transporter [Streptomyces tubercidicus]|uniref:MFS transporter n=1 Tax=Streptomyces tubercidicus TaxID=47759 RepID=UPI0022B77CA7|nr:MFS transporter [Streptomyces tubercidicus]WAU10168.1 MFS transporter [Streptomyces tubercidicus]